MNNYKCDNIIFKFNLMFVQWKKNRNFFLLSIQTSKKWFRVKKKLNQIFVFFLTLYYQKTKQGIIINLWIITNAIKLFLNLN